MSVHCAEVYTDKDVLTICLYIVQRYIQTKMYSLYVCTAPAVVPV